MEPSVTYLPLLATTPFFTRLSRNQLQWVIDHSKEWNAFKGTEISASSKGPDNFWVLLDGGWQVEHNGKIYKVGHGDAGKWYGGEQLDQLKQVTRLVATENSYVMNIKIADLSEMLKQRFPFDQHLQDGIQYYKNILKY